MISQFGMAAKKKKAAASKGKKGMPKGHTKITAAQVEKGVQEYLEANPGCPTLQGLAVHLGITYETLCNWRRVKSNTPKVISDAIKKAHAEFESRQESFHIQNLSKSVVGSIFFLKCKRGWKEPAQEVEHQGGIKIGGIKITVTGRDNKPIDI